jgi:hypothetical protein
MVLELCWFGQFMLDLVQEVHFSHVCTLEETEIGPLVYANGRPGGTVITITLLLTFIMILFTVRLPTHLEQTKSVCAIISLYAKNCIMLETVREAKK